MDKKIIICGDSFAKGIGCRDLVNEPYGSLLSKELNMPLINLAKGSSTHLSIYLQAKYAVDNYADSAGLVIVTCTSYDRVEWFPWDYTHPGRDYTNADVNYHEYPPYMPGSYAVSEHDGQPHPMIDDEMYTGKMFTENLMGVIDYWETTASKGIRGGYYSRFGNEPKERMKVLYDYAAHIHDPSINRLHSIGLLTMAHQLLSKAGIRHLIGTHEVEAYSAFINRSNLVNIDWGQLALDYPDDLPSWHTSSKGHEVAKNAVIEKLKENGWTYGN
jgi:hypothetical protein